MANYSKEAERQSKALQNILDGREPESKIMVGYEGDKIELTETEKEERKVSAERADVFKEARTPWFCPKCDRFFPIIEEIPIMLPDELRDKKQEMEFLKTNKDKLPEKIITKANPWHL